MSVGQGYGGRGGWCPLAWMLVSLFTVGALPAVAADLRQGESVVVGPDEVVDEDIYVVGQTVTIQGIVRGDVVAFANTLDVEGAVTGDVMGVAAIMRISGDVGGSVRLLASEVSIPGQIGQDAVIGASSLRFDSASQVGQDALLAAGRATLGGPVAGDLYAAGGELALQAPVRGDANAQVGRLEFAGEGRVGGDLTYRAEREASIPVGAVRGAVEYQPPIKRTPLMYALGWLRALVGLFALGLVLVLVSPTLARRAPGALGQAPWKSLGIGVAFVVGVPFAAAMIFAVGVLIGGWWIGLLVLAVYAMALLLAFPVVGLYVGGWLLERFGKAGPPLVLALLVGLALVLLVGQVPILGGLVVLATLLFGTGAILLAASRVRRPMAAAM